MLRRLTPRQLAFDLGFSALCVLVRVALSASIASLESLFVLLMGAALALRRLAPGPALAVAWAGAALQMALGLAPDLANLSILAVLYATAAYGTTRVRWLGLASAGVGAVVAALYLVFLPIAMNAMSSPTAIPVADLPFSLVALGFTATGMLVLLGLSWTLGLLARTRAAARESRIAQVRAEHEELEARRLAIVEQERNRIARDMHDVVAHSLAVVIAQADGARYAIAGDPDAASAALSTISSTAREALGDVRVLLGQLRHSQGEGPQPTLGDLPRLLDQVRSSGLAIRESTTGQPRSLGTPQELAVYRIVQEALTNALRHGDSGEPADLAFEWGSGDLRIRVTSRLRRGFDGPAPSTGTVPVSLGHGLAGMRERANLVGGRLSAEPRGERFVVEASIPIQRDAAHPVRNNAGTHPEQGATIG